jgi:hypothetical protein
VLERIADSANSSPNTDFIMDLGIENIVGRDNTFPQVVVKSAFVIGLGDTAFIGPDIDSSTIIYRISPSKSSNPIQLICSLPFPILPPKPTLKRGRIFDLFIDIDIMLWFIHYISVNVAIAEEKDCYSRISMILKIARDLLTFLKISPH